VATVDGPNAPIGGPTSLLQRADLAVYDAKQRGPGSVVCYDAGFGERIAQQTDIEGALAAALQPDADELRLVFQPIVSTSTGAVNRFEALVRWQRPGHGHVAPDEFVPIAERTGLVVQLDKWVLRTAAGHLAAWATDPMLADASLAVNVSGRTLLQATFVADVAAALETHGVEPERVTLEVTETALVTDLGLVASQLERLRALGVRIAIDDFGTGYTSIAQLRALPVDDLKIDGSFVSRLPETGDWLLVKMISDVAGLLGLVTIAEGVETEAHIDALQRIGCDALQGYYFARPIEAEAIAEWVTHRALTMSEPPA
jgi:predicted signal transduction protein with EAL and GGDEF domain